MDAADHIQMTQWSPKEHALAFVMENDLYYMEDCSVSQAKRLTTSGRQGLIFNGIADWLYEGITKNITIFRCSKTQWILSKICIRNYGSARIKGDSTPSAVSQDKIRDMFTCISCIPLIIFLCYACMTSIEYIQAY